MGILRGTHATQATLSRRMARIRDIVGSGVVAGAVGGHCFGFHSGVGGHSEHVGRAGAAAGRGEHVGRAGAAVGVVEHVGRAGAAAG